MSSYSIITLLAGIHTIANQNILMELLMEHLQVPNQSLEIWAESCQLYSFNQSMFYMHIVCIALFATVNNCICFFRFIHWHLLDSLSMSGLSMGNRIKWFSFVFFVFLLGIPKMAVTHHHYIVSTVFLCVPVRMTDFMDDCGVPKSTNLGNAHVRTNPKNLVGVVYVYPLVMSK